MARLTLLDIVQNILSALDSDEVNSISDTVEAEQVAQIVKETYEELFSNTDKPSLKTIMQLDALSNVDRPNYLLIPESVDNIDWVKYDYRTNNQTDYRDITYLCPEEFLHLVSQQGSQSNTVEITDDSGVRFWIRNDQNPLYWTTFDNETIVFDAYDANLDTTLQNSKSMAWVTKAAIFELSDDFIAPIEAKQFPLLLAEAKSVAFLNLKQVSSAKEEQRSRRQRVRAQNDLWRADQRRPYNRSPDYGRRGRRG
jgi:hypothetical protein